MGGGGSISEPSMEYIPTLKSGWFLLHSIIKIHSKYYNEHDTFRTRDKNINLSSSMLFYLNADGGRPSCAREDDSPKSCRCFS